LLTEISLIVVANEAMTLSSSTTLLERFKVSMTYVTILFDEKEILKPHQSLKLDFWEYIYFISPHTKYFMMTPILKT
jgi:hypothetical protein